MQNQVYELFDRGHKLRAIARSLNVSRNTIKSILKRRQEASSVLTNTNVGPVSQGPALNWEDVSKERAKGICFKILHQEFAPEGWDYHKFWREFQKTFPNFKKSQNITMRLEHRPAEKTFFDFSEGIDIVDAKTGEITTTQFLCGVLPFSSYTYGEFILNQKQPAFCAAIENAFAFFGGVTQYVTVDNLKSAVTRAHLYDPDVNPGFCEFANHWNFAVIPARPYKPRDKAANESAIGVIQRSFFQEVRNKTFFSLYELNQAFRQFLTRFNSQTMKEHKASRAERFEVERPLLKALPGDKFEIATHKICKVHADCHIQIQNKFYSVPHNFVGQEVNVKITDKMLQVFSKESLLIATHAILIGSQRSSTNELHYPEHKISLTKFEVKSAQAQAKAIGPHTADLVEKLITTDWPLRHLRRIQGIVRLVSSKQVSKEDMEYAAKQALAFNKTTYLYIKNAALHFKHNGNRPVLLTPQRSQADLFLHSNN
jgi:hypothetical protein